MHPVKVSDFRKFLSSQGFTFDRTKGDHEIWIKPGVNRPVVFPTKDKELSPFFIKSNLKTMELSFDDIDKFLN